MVLNKLHENKAEPHPNKKDISGFSVFRNDAFYIGRACYLPGCKEELGQYDFYVTYIVLEGQLTINLQGRDEPIVLEKGDSIMFEPGEVFFAENTSVHPAEMICIDVFGK